MSASIKSSPSPPVLPKPEGRRIKSSHSLVSPVEDHDRALLELPELKEKQVPVTDRSKMQLVPMQNDLIPDELLATLTSTICPHDRLGPPKLTKTPKDFKVYGIRHTDAVWHHPVGRKKYKYFLDQPTSLTGAGSKFTVLLEDDERMLKVFPSMRPSGRLEAVQLMKVMDEMLDRAGVNQEYRALTGLSQMQGLLELVRVEQNIYNIVFHELIRQVSVECAERGQLLAKLRQRYVALLDRIPRQLKGLHTETLAQRALDRRLTEEIICFRSSISKLNTELCKMREHDEYVSKQAERAQEELAKALEQSQKNSDVVGEYHGLYEMQRRRLEGQVARLTDERDLWSRVTYNLALKVIKLNNLQLASRLHVSEQTWTKTAEHFTLFLTSKDTEDLNHIMQLTEQWKEQLTSFVQSLREAEHGHCEGISSIQADIVKWHTFVGTNIRSPDPKFEKVSEEQLYSDLKQWSNALTIQCERYGGEDLLSCQETLKMLGQLQEAWEEVGLRLFRRHPAPDGEPPRGQEAMRELGLAVSELHKQLGTRINGESGIHKQLMSLVGVMEFWATRLKALVGRTERLPHCDWLKLEKALGSWMLLAEESLKHVHSTQPENERVKHKPHVQIEINDVFNTLREFILTQANFFDCENRRLCEEVNSIHTALTRWMVDMLLQMVPDHCDDQEQDALPGINTTAIMEVSLEQLEEDAKNLSEKLDYFSKYITSSCRAIVEEEIQRSMARDDSENELSELSKLQRECGEWMESCRILLSDKKGSPVELLVTLNLVHRSFTELLPSAMPSMESLMNLPAVVPLEALDEEEEPNKKSPMEFIEVVHMVEAEYPEEALECSLAGSIMKLIGHDGNIIERTLGEDTIQLDGTEDMVARPHTPNGQRAFDALATVGVLQHELLGVEARVQRAEERALKAEEALQAALEKIQDLERQLQGRPSLEAKVSKQSVAASPKSKVSSPEPKPVSQKPEPSPRQTKPKKR
uniref:Axonemal dynein light chain domain containing 1 n=1 Tax=Oncorhynchus mykiss TaxID=8022 RepID=A0A8K9XJ24_ONCMY